VIVMLGNGDGSFQAPVRYADPNGPFGLAVADVNGDGLPDVVTANSTGGTATVLLGKGDGSFEAPQAYASGTGPFSVAVADFNGDGLPDVVTTNVQSNNVSILLNLGDWPAHRGPVHPSAPRRRAPAGDLPALAIGVIDRAAAPAPLLPLVSPVFTPRGTVNQPLEAVTVDPQLAAERPKDRPPAVLRAGPNRAPENGLEDPLGVAPLRPA
jgi:hypothetical protein